MKQFLLPPHFSGESRILLDRESSHYLLTVRRCRPGEEFPGRDQAGVPYQLRILSVDEEGLCELEVDSHKEGMGPIEDHDEPAIVLLPCLLKGKKMDTVLRQATEAGVREIRPLVSRNTVVKPKEDRQKGDRWRKILKEAAQQSGNPGIPQISEPKSLNDIFPVPPDGVGLYFHEKPLENNPLHGYLVGRYRTVYLLIGPEGGFSPDETRLLKERGYHPVYLGANVLRAETAAVYGLGAVKTIIRERDQWIMKRSSKE